MPELSFNRIDNIFNDVSSVLSGGLDELSKIRMEEYERYIELKDRYGSIQVEVEEVLEANESCSRQCQKARELLVSSARSGDEAVEKEAYFQVEHLMKMRGSLEEREKNLRSMRDYLAREIKRKEETLKKTEELGSRFRMAIEIIDTGRKVETPEKDGVLAAAVAMAEREGLHLGRELHDGPAQKFGGAVLSVDLAEQYLISGMTEKALSELRCLRNIVEDADSEVRAFLMRLNPPGIEKGVDVALERLVAQMEKRYGIDVGMAVDGTGWQMPVYLKSNIFKIIYQAMVNAVKNGRASRIDLRVSMGKDSFRAVVKDDGRGFDVHKAKLEAESRGCYGINSMEERTSLVGGSLTIESQPGRGTTVKLVIPLKREV
ncbi:sensor histidine kinase [Dethiosulfovibrio salsuginis]|uniref:Two-component system, NarL family, sensor histidine kinase DegS n=1 Tax=Dethiosulfovibrio salsuginis TaxID=561720 RepID=A0A1X7IXI0_9BACT|nr:sensor histidine kinase [Dethiosulfovibrio salsuginis]SMG19583.1 two-component system, NarL family, sensor histidine kinase DegS [Dethiosulfovibrio salsuginis]